MSAIFVSACQDSPHSPSTRSEPPPEHGTPEDGMLAPLDLVYVCGNRFLATNATGATVRVTYRVAGTDEGGSLTLPKEPYQHPGHSETELETVERGVVELYQEDERVARRRNLSLPCGPSPSSAFLAVTGATGEWTAPFAWPVVALHLSLLPNGKVLSWGFHGPPHIWNPATGSSTAVPSPAHLFCSGHTLLSDGRLLVAGGHIAADRGIPDISIFTPGSESWSRGTPMRQGRWYPTSTMLGNGDVVILAGKDESSVVAKEPEVWSSGTLRVLSTASFTLPYYPRAFLTPDGEVFVAGPNQRTRYLDPTGTGSWRVGGDRLYGLRDYGAAVMYEPGKIVYAGGGRTTNTAEIIDLNAGAPAWQWTGSMAVPRRHLNLTVLPTGEVLATGGSSGTAFSDLSLAVHAAELWDPATGTWTTLASNLVNRVYHSTSLLLPDGRVLHTGSGDAGETQDELNAELFSPPYLSRGPRPTITGAPSLVGYGTSFRVVTPDAADIAKVSLIRLGSTTHANNMNQRFQWLSFARSAGALTITAPGTRNRTPPGHYMLFILDGNGVPSVAKIVNVGSDSEPDPPVNAPPAADFLASCDGFTCTFSDASTDGDGTVTSWSWDFGDGGTSTARNPTHSYAAGDTRDYDLTLVATDNDEATGTVTKTITVSPPPPNIPPTADFTHSCDGFTCIFTDGSTDAGSGTVTGWSWDFGDGGTSTARNPTHTYAAGETRDYAVTLVATDNDEATGTVTKTVTVTAPPPPPPPPPPPANAPPTAAFTHSCTGLTCKFTDRSTDSDGSVMAWRWTFGNGASGTARNPTRTYAAAGTYTVTLRVTDDDAATHQTSASVTVNASIVLTVTGRTDALKQYMTLKWTGARGTRVAVYRNNVSLATTPNDGRQTYNRPLPGASRYTYKVCEVGTAVCSNVAAVVFR